MIATRQLLSQLTNEKESFYSFWIYRSKNYMILHKPWKRKGQKERECANLASTSIVLKRAGLWGQHSSERKTGEVLACPKTEGHILRDQIKKPIANNCPKETADMRSPAKVFLCFGFFWRGGRKRRVHTCHNQGKPISGRSTQVQGVHALPRLIWDAGGVWGSLQPWEGIVDGSMLGNALCCLFPWQSSSPKKHREREEDSTSMKWAVYPHPDNRW